MVRRVSSLTSGGELGISGITEARLGATAPIVIIVVVVIMAYVIWRVLMKKYSKVRLGIRNLPVSTRCCFHTRIFRLFSPSPERVPFLLKCGKCRKRT